MTGSRLARCVLGWMRVGLVFEREGGEGFREIQGPRGDRDPKRSEGKKGVEKREPEIECSAKMGVD